MTNLNRCKDCGSALYILCDGPIDPNDFVCTKCGRPIVQKNNDMKTLELSDFEIKFIMDSIAYHLNELFIGGHHHAVTRGETLLKKIENANKGKI